MPATKGKREVEERKEAAPPMLLSATRSTMTTTIHETPRRLHITWMALANPPTPLISALGNATSIAIVPAM